MTHLRANAPLAGLLALAVLSLPACSDDDPSGPDGLTRSDLVGSYEATTFETDDGSGTTDQLAAGSSIEITLSGDGSTSGRIFVPGGAEDGGDFDESLDGTWSFQAPSAVTFDLTADVFLRDVTFTAREVGGSVELEAEDTPGTVTIRVVLERV